MNQAERIRRLSWVEELAKQADYDAELAAGNVPKCRSGYQFKHPISGDELPWGLDCDRLATTSGVQQAQYCIGCPAYNVTSSTDAVVYTAYVRMVAELMNPEKDGRVTAQRFYRYSDALMRMAPRVFPKPRAIMELPSNGMFDPRNSMRELDLGAKQDADEIIGQFQNCINGVETFSYETCSDELLGLYNTAAEV